MSQFAFDLVGDTLCGELESFVVGEITSRREQIGRVPLGAVVELLLPDEGRLSRAFGHLPVVRLVALLLEAVGVVPAAAEGRWAERPERHPRESARRSP